MNNKSAMVKSTYRVKCNLTCIRIIIKGERSEFKQIINKKKASFYKFLVK